MIRTTTHTDRQALAVRVLDALCDPVFGHHGNLEHALDIADGLAELLHTYADLAQHHGEPLDLEAMKALGQAIRQQTQIANAFAEQLAIEAGEVKA